ncbi:unnamed protein product [Rhizophagus irregularis]|uniref:Uncharacterized protein n=1 Tax=Rhizophagus irregularis TaxID=588596 RepID=A0A915ZD67_9GLOM|nr:unnamed protein product [Rhizophagus irregularis]CAB5371561.1 unnamed protein product [Rhizophagus irregularis]
MDSSLKCNLMTLYSYLNNKNDGSYIFISKTKSIVNHQVIAKNENASWEIIHNIESDNVLSEAETQEQLNKINSGDYYDIVTELKLSKEDNAVYREQIKGLEKDNRRISMMYEDSIVENERLKLGLPSNDKIQSRNKRKNVDFNINFFNDNKVVDIVEIEDFQNFEVTYNREEANRKILLRGLLDKMSGKASISLYRSVIQLALLHDKYNNNYDNDDNDDDDDDNDNDDNDNDDEFSKGEKRLLKELKSVITSILRASSVLKIRKDFVLLLVNARKMVGKIAKFHLLFGDL